MKKYYAYMHKDDPDKCGFLEAVDYRDAKNWLGSKYKIKVHKIDQTDVIDMQLLYPKTKMANYVKNLLEL
jgi:hypothetical protein